MIRLCYRSHLKLNSKTDFLPLLQVLKKHSFPRPAKCSRLNSKTVGWEARRIASFTSEILFNYLDLMEPDTKAVICIDSESKSRLQIQLNQALDERGMMLQMDNVLKFLSLEELKSFFKRLIQCNSTCYNAYCGSDLSSLWVKNFTETERRYHKRMLLWSQYFGKEELEKWGGFAVFESNPYLQTERIHDGLLIQVGDNPTVFSTPEGEVLLVNAINALPPPKAMIPIFK